MTYRVILFTDDVEVKIARRLKKMNVREIKQKNKTVYQYYFMYAGARFSKSGFTTKRKAEKAGNEKLIEVKMMEQKHINPTATKKTLNEVYDEFLVIAPHYYKINTIESIKNAWKHVKSSIGLIMISEINYSILENYFSSREDNGLETNRLIRFAIQTVFDYAMKCEYVGKNPVKLIKVTGVSKSSEKELISYDNFISLTNELDSTKDFVKQSVSMAIKIGYYTGGRIGEILALEKNDFNLQNKTISFNKKLEYQQIKKSELFTSDTLKTKSSKAVLPIPDVLVQELKKWFAINHFNKVICDRNGDYMLPRSVTFHVEPIAKKLGFHFHFHLLRHTYATNLVSQGVNVKVAQELLRHANISTTLDIYTHTDNQTLKNAINSVF